MSDFREVFKRKEIKYLINTKQYEDLMCFLETIAKKDEYGLSRINNIYYDTPDHRLVRRSLEKPVYKEKLRLRTYGDTDTYSNAFIEIKKKYQGIVYKRRIPGVYKDLYGYLKDKSADIGTSQIADEIRAFVDLYGELVPAMSICYDRIALAGTEDKDLRVTFDSNIEWNERCDDLRKIRPGRKLLQPGQYLMEIKVPGAMPLELAGELGRLKIFPISFSKYGAGYMEMVKTSICGTTEENDNTRVIRINDRMKGVAAYA